jgi:ribosomal protein S18 acetylase RimI-like enzyme
MTPPGQPPIESASKSEVRQIASLLAESLFHDPLECWLFPDERSRLATSERMFRRLLRAKVADGLVRVIRNADNQVASVAVWTPPHPPAPSRWEHYAESFFMRWTYGKRIHEVRRGFTALATRHPNVPYWYLQALATRVEWRGQGHARCLLDEKFREADSQGVLTALETSLPANVAYYEKLGFQVADELMLAPGLPVWLMLQR